MDNLKSCPFCGAHSQLRGASPHVWAVCMNVMCRAEGPVVMGTEAAIAAWNRRASGWQPIETAPRDGTIILVWVDGECIVVRWLKWCNSNDPGRWELTRTGSYAADGELYADPTHWQPLPPAPEPAP